MLRLSLAEAAAHLSVSPSTVRRRVERGELRALREIMDGRTHIWVLIDPATEGAADDQAASERGATPEAAGSPAPIVLPDPRNAGPAGRVIPPSEWVTGWALRDPKTYAWVAPSSASNPRLTLRLAEARIHESEHLARTYGNWLPIEVEPAEVALGA